MLFRPATATATLTIIVHRVFSTKPEAKTAVRKLRPLSRIASKHRPRAIKEAQQALVEYLHTTRSLPFTYAEHISKNSLTSLSDAISKVPHFNPSTFSKSFRKFLRYHPINEFDFFYESIGVDSYAFSPAKKFFISEDSRVFDVACALAEFGFPWNKLGMLYKEETLVFCQEVKELNERLSRFKHLTGFDNVIIIGICLAFPRVLCQDYEQMYALFDDLKSVFVDSDLASHVHDNVDAWYEVCRKIRCFYELGLEKGKVGKLLGRCVDIFHNYREEVLVEKIDFFCRLDVRKEEIGSFLLLRPEIFSFNLDDRVISVLGFLKCFGLSMRKLRSVSEDYSFVLGRNKLCNVPQVMRSLDLNEWFFDRLKNGCHELLGNYVLESPNEDLDKDYVDGLQKIESTSKHFHAIRKLHFLHSIGFGENKFTVQVLAGMHGTDSDLQKRFNCLLQNGIQYSRICKMLRFSPKILNQKVEILESKIKYLCHEMNFCLQYLDNFPALLCYNLEKRIKPRFKFHMWLMEQGWCEKEYSLASMIATSEKNFLTRISDIHPGASKKWVEDFSNKKEVCKRQ